MPGIQKGKKHKPGAGRKPIGATPMHRLHVMLPPDLIAALRERAAAEKVSVNEIVRRALTAAVERTG